MADFEHPPHGATASHFADADAAHHALAQPHTRAADGLERIAFSLADVHRMMAADVLSPEGDWELLKGEIVWMSPANIRHARLAAKLDRFLAAHLPEHLQCLPDTRVDVPPDSQPGPDLVVFDAAYEGDEGVPVSRVQLVIEVANTTQKKDLGLKAKIYAEAGVPEYWVVDAPGGQVIVHRRAVEGRWMDVTLHVFTDALRPLCAPDLALTVTDL